MRAGRVRAAALIAIACALVAPASSASAADSKDSCKSGGYAGYVDPATGRPFAAQGDCVSSVNRGQALVSVVRDVTLSLWDRGDGVLYVHVEGETAPLSWHEVVFVVDGVPTAPTRVQISEYGHLEINYLPHPGETIQVLIDGVSVGSIVA